MDFNNKIIEILISEFKIEKWQAENLINLINEGNTIPFIARYRKEQHGSLDDQLLSAFNDRLVSLKNLFKRKSEIVNSLTELNVLTDELEHSIGNANTLSEIEDIYRPFRPKKRTRASIARENGLEPLSTAITSNVPNIEQMANEFISQDKGLNDIETVLNSARDIIAEDISNDPVLRKTLRIALYNFALLTSSAASKEDSVYRYYYDYSHSLKSLPSHVVLAINRGEKEKFLKVNIKFNKDNALNIIKKHCLNIYHNINENIMLAIADSYSRLLFPSLEREIRQSITESAEEAAVQVFAKNLKSLLMQPPLKNNTIIALDPGIRTGCKAAVVDSHSNVLDSGVLYILSSESQKEKAKHTLLNWIKKYNCKIIGIGNGTASRETQQFVIDTISILEDKPSYTVVNEAGASVYSASKVASLELPDMDVSLRSAVSLARRLIDPLSELVKIDPKSIGVGQYQHDIKPSLLDSQLKNVVESCVNNVGVNINTASPELLSYVSGIGPAVAKNIVEFRNEIGTFVNRNQLKKVKKLGPKAFEQCAGFLRINNGENPLDSTAVHPESYGTCKKLLLALNIADLKDKSLQEKLKQHSLKELSQSLDIGTPTLNDIIQELLKPGRDPRDSFPPVLLRNDVLKIDDLRPGMELTGTVRNVVDFGAFVDIGVSRDGLVHISKMSNNRVSHPSQVVKLGDIVNVFVTEVDLDRNLISLSLIKTD